MINKLVVVGVGLIGGSLARALKQARYVQSVVGMGRGLHNLQKAMELGVIDEVATSVETALDAADMVVLAAPVGSMKQILSELGPYLGSDTTITDVGSVKESVVTAARAALGDKFGNFVPGHPIAGTEKSGATASLPDLFNQRRVILTPTAETREVALQRVTAMWRMAGAEPVAMDAQVHDEIFAGTSHLPHLLAYTLVGLLSRAKLPGLGEDQSVFDFAASGFRDFSRIASSDPAMWRDICLANPKAIVKNLERFRTQLEELVAAIERADGKWLLETFSAAKKARDLYIDNQY